MLPAATSLKKRSFFQQGSNRLGSRHASLKRNPSRCPTSVEVNIVI
jgi:hypothetical protein